MNYFSLFNIEQRFDIDVKIVKTNYLALQNKFHPDKATNNIERLKFLGYSTNINMAYKILIDNFSRAQYILKLNNINFDDQSSIKVDQNLLLQVMENAELLDSLNNYNDIDQLKSKTILETDLIIDELTILFTQQNFHNALMKTIELKYHLKFLTDIQSKISLLYANFSNK